ncbi:hypothetical protein [Desulfovibrio sp.]|uniref:hypothetical protein n=1 Tax=Desulfovibrio sp. TaxID=885 RepID=UPI0023C59B67|nr:hypothetical protein [Desulfovibrio sp.]MDE7242259.1 hypothetical protein [Desulfovibrio sp.]
MIELNAATLASGGMVERLNEEIQKAVCNCLDINTEATKLRTVSLKIKIKPDKSRCFGEVSVETSSSLAPAAPIATSISMSTNLKTGEVSAAEITSGEDPAQEILPGVDGAMPGKITNFADGKSAAAGK